MLRARCGETKHPWKSFSNVLTTDPEWVFALASSPWSWILNNFNSQSRPVFLKFHVVTSRTIWKSALCCGYYTYLIFNEVLFYCCSLFFRGHTVWQKISHHHTRCNKLYIKANYEIKVNVQLKDISINDLMLILTNKSSGVQTMYCHVKLSQALSNQ